MRLVLMYGLAGYNSGECSLLDMVFKMARVAKEMNSFSFACSF